MGLIRGQEARRKESLGVLQERPSTLSLFNLKELLDHIIVIDRQHVPLGPYFGKKLLKIAPFTPWLRKEKKIPFALLASNSGKV